MLLSSRHILRNRFPLIDCNPDALESRMHESSSMTGLDVRWHLEQRPPCFLSRVPQRINPEGPALQVTPPAAALC